LFRFAFFVFFFEFFAVVFGSFYSVLSAVLIFGFFGGVFCFFAVFGFGFGVFCPLKNRPNASGAEVWKKGAENSGKSYQ